jgi:DNA polymerase-3 subunit gamma/tau
MTLLRMLAFQPPKRSDTTPVGGGSSTKSTGMTQQSKAAAPVRADAAPQVATPAAVEKVAPLETTDWSELIRRLNLTGATRLLASNCVLLRRDGNIVYLDLDGRSESLLTTQRQQVLGEALSSHFDETLRVDISLGNAKAAETPVQEEVRLGDEALQAARVSLESDPNVQALKDMFGATMNADSVQILNDQSSANQE